MPSSTGTTWPSWRRSSSSPCQRPSFDRPPAPLVGALGVSRRDVEQAEQQQRGAMVPEQLAGGEVDLDEAAVRLGDEPRVAGRPRRGCGTAARPTAPSARG